MHDENMDKLPEGARIGLAMALLKSLPPSTLHDLTKKLQERRDAPKGEGESDAPPMPRMEIEFIDGTGMSPEQLKEAIARGPAPLRRRAATLDEVIDFNRRHEPPLRVGDLVRWRPGMQQCDWPAMGEEVVVSQIIAPPMRQDSDATSVMAANRFDIAVAFVSTKPGGGEDAISEFVFDSRRFERVSGATPDRASPSSYLKSVLTMPAATPEAA